MLPGESSEFGAVFEAPPTYVPSGTLHEGWVGRTRSRWWTYGANPGQDAAAFVLVHGFRGDHHGLQLLASGLTDFEVFVPDLPGFGRTEPLEGAEHSVSTYAAWLVDFIETSVGRPVHLVGHSFGSIVTSYLALVRPQLVEKLTLINPICQPALEGKQRVMSRLADVYYRLGAALPHRAGLALLRSQLITWLSSEFMMKSSDARLRAFINHQHLAYFGSFAEPGSLLQAYRASISTTAAEFVAALPQPVQMIVGAEDDLGSLELQEKMAGSLQAGRLDVIPQVGHLIHYETPLRAAALIRDFHIQEGL